MRGQWLGRFEGTRTGNLMINIDELEDRFAGVAYLTPDGNDLPGTVVSLETTHKGPRHHVKAFTFPIDPVTGFQGIWENVKKLYSEDITHSKEADVNLNLSGERLEINALSDNGVEVNAVLEQLSKEGESKVLAKIMTWQEFRTYVATKSRGGFLYRGQQKPWRLCTSFHRRARYRISEFTQKDVRQLHQKLSAITSHYFDLSVPDQNGAFFSLLQHHGYPTPLLDWSHSPYVAAFFAFRDRPIAYEGEGNIRIYIFNNSEWQKKVRQIQNLDPPFPHLSVMEFLAVGNPRLIPQQAVTTVTNISDIEAYVISKEKETGLVFLEAIDIPANHREEAMMELRFMGITAGSMFPGLDGICEELRERNFDR